jgi:hypothetical protein
VTPPPPSVPVFSVAIFADAVARADFQPGMFALEFQVLRDLAHCGKGKDHGFVAESRSSR